MMEVFAFLAAAFPAILISLVVGVAAAVAILVISSARRGKPTGIVPAVVVGLVVALVVFGAQAYGQAYTPVEKGTVALVQRFGGLTGDVFDPGLHWRTPFIDQVVIVPTIVLSYETSDFPETSGADYPEPAIPAQTTDGQQIVLKYTVLFRMPDDESAADIVQSLGSVDHVVENVVKRSRSVARTRAQDYTAEELYSGDGILAYQEQVRSELRTIFAGYGIVLDDFLVRKIDFNEDYINAIEQQQIAQEAIETARYQSEAAEYEKERQIRLAEAEAERTKLLADADAERQRLLADAEAYSIEARGEMLQQYPEMVQWEFVRNLEAVEWGILPSEGVTPFLPIPSFEGESVLPTE